MLLRTFALIAALGWTVTAQAATRECAQSPGKVLEVCVWVENGQALYEVSRKGTVVLAPSELGMTFKGEMPARFTGLAAARRSESDSTWEQPWGEQRIIRDNHAELTVTLNGRYDATTRRSTSPFACSMTASASAMPIAPSQPGRTSPSPQSAPSSAPSARIRRGGIEGFGQERDEYLYTADRRAPDHARRDAADAQGRERPATCRSTKRRWSISRSMLLAGQWRGHADRVADAVARRCAGEEDRAVHDAVADRADRR